jgi:Protein of unknown function (DUF664).
VQDGGMHATAIVLDAFGRVHELLPVALEGLTREDLLWRPDSGANSIAWLAWHLARVEDDHLSGVAGTEQLWTSRGWWDRFRLPYPPRSVGYGQRPDDVGAFVLDDPALLTGYYSAVHARTVEIVSALGDEDWDRVVDRRWDPPVTVAVRIVSVINDVTQHVGQIGYVRGLLERASGRDSGWKGHA